MSEYLQVTLIRRCRKMVSKHLCVWCGVCVWVSLFQSLLLGSSVGLPQLPLPCISSSATRVYFGHQRCLAEGSRLSVLFHRRKKTSFLTDLNSQTEALHSVFNGHLAQLNPNPGLFQVLSTSCSSQDPSAEG